MPRLLNGKVASSPAPCTLGTKATLISTLQLFNRHNLCLMFGKNPTLVRNGHTIATGTCTGNGLYWLDAALAPPATATGASALLTPAPPSRPLGPNTLRTSHYTPLSRCRLARHQGFSAKKEIGSEGSSKLLRNIYNNAHTSCLPVPASTSLSSRPQELVHVLAVNWPSYSGCRYAATSVHDYVPFLWVKALWRKSEALFALISEPRRSSSPATRIVCLCSNHGSNYISHSFADFLHMHGVTHKITAPYLPQSNGVAERENRSLVKASSPWRGKQARETSCGPRLSLALSPARIAHCLPLSRPALFRLTTCFDHIRIWVCCT